MADPIHGRFLVFVRAVAANYWRNTLVIFSMALLGGAASVTADDDLAVRADGPSTLGQKVDVRLEIRGNVSADFDGESARNVPLKVDAKFSYRERQLRSQNSTRFIRDYNTAEALIDYGKGQESSALGPDNRWLIVDRRSDASQAKRLRYLTSSSGLEQTELDLVAIPANTVVWDLLLERSPVARGDQWTPESTLLADVLTIDSIQSNNVQLELVQVDNGIATIGIRGTATGFIDDAETEINVNGSCQFDLNAGYTRQLRLTLQENRTICESAPGFDAVIKLEVQVDRPRQDVFPQSDIKNAGLDKRKWTDYLVMTNPSGDYRLRYDRRWRLIANDGQSAVLRFVDGNVLLGQCNVQTLPQIASKSAYTPEAFRRDIEQVTKEKGTIADERSWVTEQGMTVMCIDIKGKVDDVDVVWRYYHVTQPDGQRLSSVITFDAEVGSRFEGVDQRLVDSVEFLRTKDAAGPARNASAPIQSK
jgi:hypothetical protein